MADETVPPADPPVITRDEALAGGLTRYFTGKPCKHGHVSERRASTRACLECAKRLEAAYKKGNRKKTRAYQAEYRTRNLEKVRAYVAAYRSRHPERLREQEAQNRVRNAESIKKAQKEWRARNPDQVREIDAAWRRANPDKAKAKYRNRQARKRAAEGFHTAEDVQRIYDAQRGKCACCKKKVEGRYDVDHIVALSKGGSNWPANLQILCPFCNGSKNNKDSIEFMQSLGFLL